MYYSGIYSDTIIIAWKDKLIAMGDRMATIHFKSISCS